MFQRRHSSTVTILFAVQFFFPFLFTFSVIIGRGISHTKLHTVEKSHFYNTEKLEVKSKPHTIISVTISMTDTVMGLTPLALYFLSFGEPTENTFKVYFKDHPQRTTCHRSMWKSLSRYYLLFISNCIRPSLCIKIKDVIKTRVFAQR